MRKTSWIVLLALAAFAVARADLSACGDKFLRVGRSARFRGYASVHPSSILVYAPHWTAQGITEFERMLNRGGHKAVTVTTTNALGKAFADGRYDLVVVHYSDADVVTRELSALTVKPGLLPVLYKPTKTEAANAAATYKHLLKPEKMTPFQALEEIDRLLDARLKSGPAAASR